MIESFRSKNVILAKTIFCQKARIGGGRSLVPGPLGLLFPQKKDRGLKKKTIFLRKKLTSIFPNLKPYLIVITQVRNMLSPGGGPSLVVPYVVPIWSLSLLYLTLPQDKFFGFQFAGGICSFLTPRNSLSPGGGPSFGGPLWGTPLISFYFISGPGRSFFHFNLLAVSAHFWPLKFFNVTDGWWIVVDGGRWTVDGFQKVHWFCSKFLHMKFTAYNLAVFWKLCEKLF